MSSVPTNLRSHSFNAVYVLELLDPQDSSRTGTSLFESVVEPLAVANGIEPQLLKLPTNADLVPALGEIAHRCRRRQSSPILHFETHGSVAGLGRTCEPMVPWKELAAPLAAINHVSRGNLLVTMAACHGANVVAVFAGAPQMPIWALVGPTTAVLPSDIGRGFQAFYRTILTTFDIGMALASLRAADRSVPEGWYFQSAEVMLAVAYGLHRAKHDGPGGRLDTEHTILKMARRADKKAGRTRAHLRAAIRKSLNKQDEFFNDLKRRFLMIDRFPENAERFPIEPSECIRLFERWRAGGGRLGL